MGLLHDVPLMLATSAAEVARPARKMTAEIFEREVSVSHGSLDDQGGSIVEAPGTDFPTLRVMACYTDR